MFFSWLLIIGILYRMAYKIWHRANFLHPECGIMILYESFYSWTFTRNKICIWWRFQKNDFFFNFIYNMARTATMNCFCLKYMKLVENIFSFSKAAGSKAFIILYLNLLLYQHHFGLALVHQFTVFSANQIEIWRRKVSQC